MAAAWKEEEPTDASRQRRCFVFPIAKETIRPQRAVLGVAPGTQSLQNDVRRLSIETEPGRDHAKPLVLRRKRCTNIGRKIQALSDRKQELNDAFMETMLQMNKSIKDQANSKLKQTGDRLEGLQQELQRDLTTLESMESLHGSSTSTIEKIRHSMETGRVSVNEERCLLNGFFEEEWVGQEQSMEGYLEKHFLAMREVCYLMPSDQETFANEQRSKFRTSWNTFKEEIEQSWLTLETTFVEGLKTHQERVSLLVTRWKLLQLDNRIGSLLDSLKGDDFWKPADVVVTVSEINTLIPERNSQFLKWIQKASCIVKTSSKPATLDLMKTQMNQQISSWKQQNSGLVLSLQESLTRLNNGAEDHSQLLSKAEEELQQYSEKLSMEEKLSEGRRIIRDRQSCFKRLEQSVIQCLRRQLIHLKRISIKYMEFLKQLCSLRQNYQQNVKEAKEGLEKDWQDMIDSIEECFADTQTSLFNKIKEVESCDEESSLVACIGRLDADLAHSKTELHTFGELWKTKTSEFSTTLEQTASEWTQSLTHALFIEQTAQEEKRDVSELAKSIYSIDCEVDLSDLEDEASIGQEESGLEPSSEFMGSQEGQELQALYKLELDSQVDDALSQGLRFIQDLTSSDARRLIENNNQELKSAEELLSSKLESLLNERASALDHLKLQDATKIQERILKDIAIAETTLNNHLLELNHALQRIKTETTASLDQAHQELGRFLTNVQKHQTRMINARSLQAVENEESKLQAIDMEQLLGQTVSPMQTKLELLIQNLKENLEQLKSNPLCGQDIIDQKIKLKLGHQLVEFHKQVDDARIEIQNDFDHVHRTSEEQVLKLKSEILDSVPALKAEVEIVRALDKLTMDLQSELKTVHDQRKLQISQITVQYQALQYLHTIGVHTSKTEVSQQTTSKSSEINEESKHKKSVDLCKETIQQEVECLSKVLLLKQGFKLETVEKLSYVVAALKMAFNVTSLLMQICCELFCLEIPEDSRQVQLDVIRFGPLEIINDSEILKESTKKESLESNLLQKYTEKIKKIGDEFFIAAKGRSTKFRDISQSLTYTHEIIKDFSKDSEDQTTNCKAKIKKLVQNVISQIEVLLNPICRNFGIAILDVFLSECELVISTPPRHDAEAENSSQWDEYRISPPSIDLRTFLHNFITQDLASKALDLTQTLEALESRFQWLRQTVDRSLDAAPTSCENRSFFIRLLEHMSNQRQLENPSDLLKKMKQLSQEMKESCGPRRGCLEAIDHQLGKVFDEVLEVVITVEVSYTSQRELRVNRLGS